MYDIYLILRSISDMRAQAYRPEIDVRLKKLEREIEEELLDWQDQEFLAHC